MDVGHHSKQGGYGAGEQAVPEIPADRDVDDVVAQAVAAVQLVFVAAEDLALDGLIVAGEQVERLPLEHDSHIEASEPPRPRDIQLDVLGQTRVE